VIFVIGTFIGVLTIVVGAYWAFVLQPEAAEQKRLDKRLRPERAQRRGRLTMPTVEPTHANLLASLQRTIVLSGLNVTASALLFACGMSGFMAAFALWQLADLGLPGVVVGAAASTIPYLVVRRTAGRRMAKFEEQFPEAVDLIARALRAGHAFTTALSMVVDEVPAPVGPEFKLLYDRQSFGMPFPDALKAFAERVPSLDARFFVTAVLTQRDAGGNLAGVLDNLSAVIRERFQMKRQARVTSAHARMTASMLMALPPGIAAIQAVIAPGNMRALLRDPLGVQLLVAAALLQVVGMFVIHRMVKVEC
jgi:tight adherence protein B